MGDGDSYADGPYNDDPDRGPSTAEENADRADELADDEDVEDELTRLEKGLGIYESDDDEDEPEPEPEPEEDEGEWWEMDFDRQEWGDSAATGAAGVSRSQPPDGDDSAPPQPDGVPSGGYDDPDQYSDLLHESDVIDVEALAAAETPEEFAEAVFADRAIAPELRDGGDGMDDVFPPEEPSWQGRIGGWNDFDIRDGEGMIVVREADVISISGASSKAIFDLPQSYDADRVFVQYYEDPPGDDMHDAGWWKAHSQMGVYSFLSASGLRTPRFTADFVKGWVAVEEVGTKTGVQTFELRNIAESNVDVADRVDADEFRDQMAVNLLAQNWDIPPRNVRIGEDGSVHTFDFDYANRAYTDFASMEADATHADESVEILNRLRSEELEVDSSGIVDRAEEIAVAMRESGHEQRILESVRSYDEAVPSQALTRKGGYADRIEAMIDAAMDATGASGG